MATDTALRVTCSKSDLAAALGVVARAVSTRGAVQVLGGVLLRAEEGRLTLAATDMEISLRASVTGDVEGDASVVVPGRLLTDLVRLLPDDTVTLAHEDGGGVLAVTSGSHSSRLNVYSAEDFPRLPPLDVQLHRIEAAGLLETIDKVGRAASRDESRPVLTGILVRFEGDRLVMAATDSYRLAVKETPLAAGGPDLEAIIPARALQELTRIAAGADDVELGVHENHVIFAAGGVWLTSRRIDGQFPNYKQLLPESFEIEITTPRVPLLEVVRRAGLMAQRNAPLRLRFAEGELTVSAQTQDVGEATESLPVEFSGEELEIGFNPDFLRDGLDAVAGDTVQLKLINRLRPGLVAEEVRVESDLELLSGELDRERFRRLAHVLRLRGHCELALGEAQSQDVGEATESLPVEFSGEELEIGFNPDFLRDGLDAVAGDTVQLKLINRLRPGLVAAPEESFWYLIMPIRLAG